jgi:hypothetical protein
MKPKEKTDAELAADARMVGTELNRLHVEMAKRGITIDYGFGYEPGEFKFEYSRVKKEVL